jgi:NEDD4-binding protein 2
MGQVIAMRAIPGSGKSTLAKQLIAKAKSEGKTTLICSADDFFYQLGNGTYAFDRTRISEAHKYCFKKFIKAISDNIDLIIVDNTNLNAWEVSPYKTYAEAHDYTFGINEVVTNQAEAFKRQQHGVPEGAHARIAENFDNSDIPPWWDSKRMVSRTDSSGSPVFEEEQKPVNPQLNLPFDSIKASLFLQKIAGIFSERYRI